MMKRTRICTIGLSAMLACASLAAAQQPPKPPTPPQAAAKAQAEPPKKPRVAITISKETTYITGPLRPDGYVDYVAAMNERASKGVTPENNAAVPFLRAMWPGVMDSKFDKMDAKYRDEYCRMLGIAPLPEKGDYFITSENYVKGLVAAEKAAARPGEDWDGTFWKQLGLARTRAWSNEEFPILAGWLAANEKPLALLVAASRRPRRYDPLISRSGGVIGILVPAVQQYREAERALTARAMLRVDEGKVDEAWEDLLACHRLARLAGQGPTLVEALFAISVDETACAGDQALLRHARLTPARIARMRADLDKLPPMPKMVDKIDVFERFGYPVLAPTASTKPDH
jgi:hypothetical protein